MTARRLTQRKFTREDRPRVANVPMSRIARRWRVSLQEPATGHLQSTGDLPMTAKTRVLSALISTATGLTLLATPTLALNPQPLPPGRRGGIIIVLRDKVVSYLGENSGGNGRGKPH